MSDPVMRAREPPDPPAGWLVRLGGVLLALFWLGIVGQGAIAFCVAVLAWRGP